MKEDILSLLGDYGLTQRQVADTLGCEESYVSQLMAQEEFRSEVMARRSAKATEYREHDCKVDGGEERALQRVLETIGVMKPMEALKAFQVLNGAKRRSAVQSGPQHVTQIVNVELPESAMVHFRIAPESREVIEVEGRSLATLPAGNVRQMLASRTAAQLTALETAKEVPGAHSLPALPAALRRARPEDSV